MRGSRAQGRTRHMRTFRMAEQLSLPWWQMDSPRANKSMSYNQPSELLQVYGCLLSGSKAGCFEDWRQIVLLIGNNQFDVKLGDQNWGLRIKEIGWHEWKEVNLKLEFPRWFFQTRVTGKPCELQNPLERRGSDEQIGLTLFHCGKAKF